MDPCSLGKQQEDEQVAFRALFAVTSTVLGRASLSIEDSKALIP